jgi:hypothetical protein
MRLSIINTKEPWITARKNYAKEVIASADKAQALDILLNSFMKKVYELFLDSVIALKEG